MTKKSIILAGSLRGLLLLVFIGSLSLLFTGCVVEPGGEVRGRVVVEPRPVEIEPAIVIEPGREEGREEGRRR